MSNAHTVYHKKIIYSTLKSLLSLILRPLRTLSRRPNPLRSSNHAPSTFHKTVSKFHRAEQYYLLRTTVSLSATLLSTNNSQPALRTSTISFQNMMSTTATSTSSTSTFPDVFPSTSLSRRARDSLLLHRGYTAPVLMRDMDADIDVEGDCATPLARRFRDSLDIVRPIYAESKKRRSARKGIRGWVRGAWYGIMIRGD
jgi:hypothetical protein